MNPLLMIAEESFAKLHDKITNRLILEHLLKYGKVTIEEAKFYKDFSGKILYESSHLLIPSKEEILESLTIEESAAKVLVDPETGEKYIYNMETGELIPASDDADIEDDDAVKDAEDAARDAVDAAADAEDAAEDIEDSLEDKEEIADSCKNESTEVNESETKENKVKELNENEILIEKLLQTLKN